MMRAAFRTAKRVVGIMPIALFAALILLGGCGGYPIAAEPSSDFVDQEEAEALIGSTKEHVIEQLGEPTWRIGDGASEHFIYYSKVPANRFRVDLLPFVVLPSSVLEKEMQGWAGIHCALLTFEESGALDVVQFKSGASYLPENPRRLCLYAFFGWPEGDRLASPSNRIIIEEQGEKPKKILAYRDPDIVGDNYAILDLVPDGFVFSRFAILRMTPTRAEPIDDIGVTLMHLKPGRYLLDFWADYPNVGDDARGATVYGIVELKPRTKYRIKGRYCSFLCGDTSSGAATWVENEETGEVILGQKTPPYKQ